MNTLARQPGWPLRLNQAIESARGVPFDWTSHNCAVFAADCLAAITGVHVHARFAALMATERRARAFGPALAPRVDVVLGAERRVPPVEAQRGDVVLLAIPAPADSALGICVGKTAAAVSPAGLVFIPMARARCAWHI